MIELPYYISATFIFNVFLTLGFLFAAVKQVGFNLFPAKVFVGLILFWLLLQGLLVCCSRCAFQSFGFALETVYE